MKIKWLGHSSFKITLDNGRTIITDPFDDSVGYPMPGESADIVLSSHDHFDHNCFSAVSGDPEIINAPGSYERFGAAIHGVASFHDDARGAKRGTNVIFTVEADGVRLTHLGDLGHLPETPDPSAAIEGADVHLHHHDAPGGSADRALQAEGRRRHALQEPLLRLPRLGRSRIRPADRRKVPSE